MVYKIHCTNCMRKWIIDDPMFDQLVKLIEESAGKMSDVLYTHNVPVSYKSHCHVFPILQTLIRCCAVPEISLVAIDAGGE